VKNATVYVKGLFVGANATPSKRFPITLPPSSTPTNVSKANGFYQPRNTVRFCRTFSRAIYPSRETDARSFFFCPRRRRSTYSSFVGFSRVWGRGRATLSLRVRIFRNRKYPSFCFSSLETVVVGIIVDKSAVRSGLLFRTFRTVHFRSAGTNGKISFAFPIDFRSER